MEKIKITNSRQFEKLVEELEKNPSLARGFQKGSVPQNCNEQWETIATVVNSFGPPIRSGSGWQKIWRDRKFKVKRKMVLNKAESKATGGGVFKQQMLSPVEEAVANLLQFEKQINPEGMVQGVANSEDLLDLFELDTAPTIGSKAAAPSTASLASTTTTTTVASTTTTTVASTTSVPSTSSAAVPSTTTTSSPNPLKRMASSALKKKEIPVKRNELLERHTSDQARILKDMSNSVMSLKRSLREIKDIEAKRLQLDVERSKREEEKHEAVMEIKKIDLLIKEKQLQLLEQ